MKWNRSLLACAFIAGLLTVTMFGCITRNPNAGQPVINPSTGQPVVDSNGHTNVQPLFVADTTKLQQVEDKIDSTLQKAQSLNTASSPVNPYAGTISIGLDAATGAAKGLYGLIGAGAMLFAWFRNKTSKDQLNTMAQGILKAGPSAASTVLAHASNSDHFSTIANAINDNTGANQNHIGVPVTAATAPA
jgi:hypothetical protein